MELSKPCCGLDPSGKSKLSSGKLEAGRLELTRAHTHVDVCCSLVYGGGVLVCVCARAWKGCHLLCVPVVCLSLTQPPGSVSIHITPLSLPCSFSVSPSARAGSPNRPLQQQASPDAVTVAPVAATPLASAAEAQVSTAAAATRVVVAASTPEGKVEMPPEHQPPIALACMDEFPALGPKPARVSSPGSPPRGKLFAAALMTRTAPPQPHAAPSARTGSPTGPP